MVIMFGGQNVVNFLPDAIYSVVFDENDQPSVVRNELTTIDIVPFSHYGVVRYGFSVKYKSGMYNEEFAWDKELLNKGLFTSEDAAQCWIKENCRDYLFGKGDVIYAVWRFRVIELTFEHLTASDELVYCFRSDDVGGEFRVYNCGKNVSGGYWSSDLHNDVFISKKDAEECCKYLRRKHYESQYRLNKMLNMED